MKILTPEKAPKSSSSVRPCLAGSNEDLLIFFLSMFSTMELEQSLAKLPAVPDAEVLEEIY